MKKRVVVELCDRCHIDKSLIINCDVCDKRVCSDCTWDPDSGAHFRVSICRNYCARIPKIEEHLSELKKEYWNRFNSEKQLLRKIYKEVTPLSSQD